MQSIEMLSVHLCYAIYAECHIQALYAEYRYGERRYAQCCYVECRSAFYTRKLRPL